MKKALYNPINEDFTVTYDINNDMNPVLFTATAMGISYFEEPVWDHVRKHLIDFVMNTRGLNPILPKNWEDVKKEVDVEI